MQTGETKNGFKWKVKDDVLNDQEIIDLLAYNNETDPLMLTKLADRVLGAEQKKKLYEHLRNKKTGIVPSDKVNETFGEIFGAIGNAKK